MTSKRKNEVQPWRPTLRREPELNPFANPLDRELENPPPLADSDAEDDESAHNSGSISG
jgi:hypothetical protein